jgi:antirestriction protein ArdC
MGIWGDAIVVQTVEEAIFRAASAASKGADYLLAFGEDRS